VLIQVVVAEPDELAIESEREAPITEDEALPLDAPVLSTTPPVTVCSSRIKLSPRLHDASSPEVGLYHKTLSPKLQVLVTEGASPTGSPDTVQLPADEPTAEEIAAICPTEVPTPADEPTAATIVLVCPVTVALPEDVPVVDEIDVACPVTAPTPVDTATVSQRAMPMIVEDALPPAVPVLSTTPEVTGVNNGRLGIRGSFLLRLIPQKPFRSKL